MRILGLIPARGGSKRIPGKNKKLLAGKPLINWTIELAKTSASICDIVVSTDDPEIAALMRLIKTINNSISNNKPGCDIKMRLAIYALINFTGVA